MKQNRIDMLREDKEVKFAEYQSFEEKFAEIENLKPDFAKKEMEFGADLPGTYDKSFTDRSVYEYGTGVDNEDELDDIRQAEALKRKGSVKRSASDSMKRTERRQDEAAIRQTGRDRLSFGRGCGAMPAREHMKTSKSVNWQQRSRAVQSKEHQDQLRSVSSSTDRICFAISGAQRLEDERKQMTYEDMRKHDIDVSDAEVKLMEHEDIRSQMHARDIARKKGGGDRGNGFLKEIYTEHKLKLAKSREATSASSFEQEEEYEEELHMQNLGGDSLAVPP